MSPTTRRAFLQRAGATTALLGTSRVSGVCAVDAAASAPAGGLASVISVDESYPLPLAYVAGTLLAAWAHWTIEERRHFLVEFERTFPALSASLALNIDRRMAAD